MLGQKSADVILKYYFLEKRVRHFMQFVAQKIGFDMQMASENSENRVCLSPQVIKYMYSYV